jgi:hypothetical protein
MGLGSWRAVRSDDKQVRLRRHFLQAAAGALHAQPARLLPVRRGRASGMAGCCCTTQCTASQKGAWSSNLLLVSHLPCCPHTPAYCLATRPGAVVAAPSVAQPTAQTCSGGDAALRGQLAGWGPDARDSWRVLLVAVLLLKCGQ